MNQSQQIALRTNYYQVSPDWRELVKSSSKFRQMIHTSLQRMSLSSWKLGKNNDMCKREVHDKMNKDALLSALALK